VTEDEVNPEKAKHWREHAAKAARVERWAEGSGNGEQLPATGGQSPSLTATDRCKDCVSHGPW
jgi:hypothetical protein